MSAGPVLNYATPLGNRRSWLGRLLVIAGLLVSSAVIASRLLDGIAVRSAASAAGPSVAVGFTIDLPTTDMGSEVFVCPATLPSDRGFQNSDAVARSYQVANFSFKSARPLTPDVVYRENIYAVRPAPPATRPSAEDTVDTILLPADE